MTLLLIQFFVIVNLIIFDSYPLSFHIQICNRFKHFLRVKSLQIDYLSYFRFIHSALNVLSQAVQFFDQFMLNASLVVILYYFERKYFILPLKILQILIFDLIQDLLGFCFEKWTMIVALQLPVILNHLLTDLDRQIVVCL